MQSLPPPALPPAGWYADPDGDMSRIRWWDGTQWTAHYRARDLTPPQPPRSLRGVAVCAVVAVAAVVVVEAWSVSAYLNYRNATGELIAGAESTRVYGALQWIEDAERYVLIAFLVAAVPFLAWFRFAYVNLERRGVAMRFTSGWSVGAWFVPFLNLVRPKYIADDVYRGSKALELGVQPSRVAVAPLVHLWWTAWILSGVAFFVARAVVGDANTDYLHGREDFVDAIQREQGGMLVAVVASGISVLAGALAVLYILRVTAAQRDIAESPAALSAADVPPIVHSVGPPA